MTANPNLLHPDLPDGSGQPADDRLLAGKYKSTPELERGYDELFKEGQRLVQRVRELENQQVASSEDWSGGDLGADRVMPSDRRDARRDPVDALSMAGIPVNELKEFVRREVYQEVNPVFQGAAARQTVAQDYPEFAQFEGELAQFVEANPQLKARYQKTYAVDPEVALKWAFNEFTRARGGNHTSASGEAQAAARLDASLPGRVAPRRAVPGEFDWDHYNRLKQEAMVTKDWSKVTAYKLQGSIPDSHLNGLQG